MKLDRKSLLILGGAIVALLGGCCLLALVGAIFGERSTTIRTRLVTPTATIPIIEMPLPTETFTPEPVVVPPTEAAATEAPPPVPQPASVCPQGCELSSPGCEIKGNINREGEKIYHLPSGRDYNKTEIDSGKGERWFCTSVEAEANGWRASEN